MAKERITISVPLKLKKAVEAVTPISFAQLTEHWAEDWLNKKTAITPIEKTASNSPVIK